MKNKFKFDFESLFWRHFDAKITKLENMCAVLYPNSGSIGWIQRNFYPNGNLCLNYRPAWGNFSNSCFKSLLWHHFGAKIVKSEDKYAVSCSNSVSTCHIKQERSRNSGLCLNSRSALRKISTSYFKSLFWHHFGAKRKKKEPNWRINVLFNVFYGTIANV